MKMLTNATVRAVKEQVSCELDGESVILSLKNGVYYGLDPVGATIWNFIQEPRALTEIREAILSEYDVEPSQCEKDVLALLESLENEGLIEIHGSPAA